MAHGGRAGGERRNPFTCEEMRATQQLHLNVQLRWGETMIYDVLVVTSKPAAFQQLSCLISPSSSEAATHAGPPPEVLGRSKSKKKRDLIRLKQRLAAGDPLVQHLMW